MQSGIHDAFMEKLGKAMDAELRMGHGFDPTTTQGPLINIRAAEKVLPTSRVSNCAVCACCFQTCDKSVPFQMNYLFNLNNFPVIQIYVNRAVNYGQCQKAPIQKSIYGFRSNL